MSPRCPSASRWAVVAPTLPAPITVILGFLIAIPLRQGSRLPPTFLTRRLQYHPLPGNHKRRRTANPPHGRRPWRAAPPSRSRSPPPGPRHGVRALEMHKKGVYKRAVAAFEELSLIHISEPTRPY